MERRVLGPLADGVVGLPLLLLVGVELGLLGGHDLAVGLAEGEAELLHLPLLDDQLVLLVLECGLQFVQILLVALQLVNLALHRAHLPPLGVQLRQLPQKLLVALLLAPPAALLDHRQSRLELLQLPYHRHLSPAVGQPASQFLQRRHLLGDEFRMVVLRQGIGYLEFPLLLLQPEPSQIQMLLQLHQFPLLGGQHLLHVAQVQLLILELDGVRGGLRGQRLLRGELRIAKGDVPAPLSPLVSSDHGHGPLGLINRILPPEHASLQHLHLNYIRYYPPPQYLQLMKALFIIGPSGAGKTTLAHALATLHGEMFGAGSAVRVNLDCAAEGGEVDICEVVRLEEIMEELQLGPNGSLLYAAELLEKNVEWLYGAIEKAVAKRNPSAPILRNSKAVQTLALGQLQTDNILLIFDLPGQSQLFLNHDSLRNIIFSLIARFHLQPCLLQLFDSTYLYNLTDFTSMIMMSLATICHIEIPHIAVLNKIDLCKGRRPADGSLADYFSLPSLRQLLSDHLDLGEEDNVVKALAGIVDQYSQVTFSPCSVYKYDLLFALLMQMEKVFGTMQDNLMAGGRFAKEAAEHLGDVGGEAVRVNLEAELFGEEEEMDYEQELRRMKEGK